MTMCDHTTDPCPACEADRAAWEPNPKTKR
jgi:hypothetical protein